MVFFDITVIECEHHFHAFYVYDPNNLDNDKDSPNIYIQYIGTIPYIRIALIYTIYNNLNLLLVV